MADYRVNFTFIFTETNAEEFQYIKHKETVWFEVSMDFLSRSKCPRICRWSRGNRL